MCDFHSVVVNGVGQIFHNESNSHSNIITQHGLSEAINAKFWECEWNGMGTMPCLTDLVQNRRGIELEPTGAAYRAAERHYEKLAAILAGTLDIEVTAPFNTLEYSDVRREVERAKREAPIDAVIALMADMSPREEKEFLRELIEASAVTIESVAEAEIEAAEESAREDMYDDDSVNEQIGEALKEAAADCDSEPYQAGFLAGFQACKTGSEPQAAFINGVPAFLYK